MADLTSSTVAARNTIPDRHSSDLLAQLSPSQLLELDLDGPTVEILLAALTVAACDEVDSIDG